MQENTSGPVKHFARIARCAPMLLCASLAVAQAPNAAQTPPQASVSIPPPAPFTDWSSFLTAAIKLNGLTDDDMPPWHMKVSYQTFDDQGKPDDLGVFEEFHAMAGKFKVSYTGSKFTQATYGTDRQDRAVYISGGSDSSQPWPLNLLWGALISPLPIPEALSSVDIEEHEQAGNGITLSCIYAENKATMTNSLRTSILAAYCFDSGKTDLNSALVPFGSNIVLTHRIHSTSFQGRSLPLDLTIVRNNKVALTAHLEDVQVVDNFDDALFVQPSDARLYPTMRLPPGALPIIPQPGGWFGTVLSTGEQPAIKPGIQSGSAARIQLPPGTAEAHLLQRVSPVYPPIAKAARISGTVVLRAMIAKDGSIEDLSVVSGPPMLLRAALDAVKQWRYQPFQLNGQLVEVESTVNVVFQLGGPPPAAQQPPPSQ